MRNILLFLTLSFFVPFAVHAEVRDIFFPTDPALSFTDNYGDPRYQHAHEGIDILGPKITPLYSAIDGKVRYIVDPEPSYGYMIVLEGADDWSYHYIHVNNDTPGTDDGSGGTAFAYAPGISRNATVRKGQLVGWMGDSGNAENIASHLHFEIRQPDGSSINGYESLIVAQQIALGMPAPPAGASSNYDVSAALAASPNINTDKNLIGFNVPGCISGSLIKTSTDSAVYYCGANGKRYVFPNDRAYFTWYSDYSTITTISASAMAAIPLGGNVTYRPGVRMVKIQSDPRTYVIERGGILRWVTSEATAVKLYGTNWKTKIDDISDAFFVNYTVGAPVF